MPPDVKKALKVCIVAPSAWRTSKAPVKVLPPAKVLRSRVDGPIEEGSPSV